MITGTGVKRRFCPPKTDGHGYRGKPISAPLPRLITRTSKVGASLIAGTGRGTGSVEWDLPEEANAALALLESRLCPGQVQHVAQRLVHVKRRRQSATETKTRLLSAVGVLRTSL